MQYTGARSLVFLSSGVAYLSHSSLLLHKHYEKVKVCPSKVAWRNASYSRRIASLIFCLLQPFVFYKICEMSGFKIEAPTRREDMLCQQKSSFLSLRAFAISFWHFYGRNYWLWSLRRAVFVVRSFALSAEGNNGKSTFQLLRQTQGCYEARGFRYCQWIGAFNHWHFTEKRCDLSFPVIHSVFMVVKLRCRKK